MPITPSELFVSLAEHRLAATRALVDEIGSLTRVGTLAVDPFKLDRATPFERDILEYASPGGTRLQTTNLDVLPAIVASMMKACLDTDGNIDEAAAERRWGAQALELIRAARARLGTAPEHSLRTQSYLTAFLARKDPDLLADYAHSRGVAESMPVLERRLEKLGGKEPFSDCVGVLIGHNLGEQAKFLEVLAKAGLNPEDTFLAGRGYSNSELVRNLHEGRGYNLIPMHEAGLGQLHETTQAAAERAIVAAIARARTTGKRVLLYDDGGEGIHLVHTKYKRYAHLFHCVEQTTRGVIVNENVEVTRPSVRVARARAKALEGPFIAEGVVDKLLCDIEQLGRADLDGKRVVVYGYGVVGRCVAAALREKNAEVVVLEPDADKLALAAIEGCVTDMPEEQALAGAALMVGCTGRTSIGRAQLELAANDCVIASASSGEIEVDLDHLRATGALRQMPKRGGDYSNHITTDISIDGKRLLLLAQGRPVNFDGDTVTVEPEKIQLTFALLFEAGLQAVAADSGGWLDLGEEVQDEILVDLARELARARVETPPTEHQRPNYPPIPVGIPSDYRAFDRPFRQLFHDAENDPRALVSREQRLIADYPGLEGRALLAVHREQLVKDVPYRMFRAQRGFTLDLGGAEPRDFWVSGHAAVVQTGECAFRVFRIPPAAIDREGRLLPEVSEAEHVLDLDLPNGFVRLGVKVADGPVEELLYFQDTGGHICWADLSRGETGRVEGLPETAPGARLRYSHGRFSLGDLAFTIHPDHQKVSAYQRGDDAPVAVGLPPIAPKVRPERVRRVDSDLLSRRDAEFDFWRALDAHSGSDRLAPYVERTRADERFEIDGGLRVEVRRSNDVKRSILTLDGPQGRSHRVVDGSAYGTVADGGWLQLEVQDVMHQTELLFVAQPEGEPPRLIAVNDSDIVRGADAFYGMTSFDLVRFEHHTGRATAVNRRERVGENVAVSGGQLISCAPRGLALLDPKTLQGGDVIPWPERYRQFHAPGGDKGGATVWAYDWDDRSVQLRYDFATRQWSGARFGSGDDFRPLASFFPHPEALFPISLDDLAPGLADTLSRYRTLFGGKLRLQDMERVEVAGAPNQRAIFRPFQMDRELWRPCVEALDRLWREPGAVDLPLARRLFEEHRELFDSPEAIRRLEGEPDAYLQWALVLAGDRLLPEVERHYAAMPDRAFLEHVRRQGGPESRAWAAARYRELTDDVRARSN